MKAFFKKIKKIYKSDKEGFVLLFSGLFLLLIYSSWRFYSLRTLSFWGKEFIQVEIQRERTGLIPVYIKAYPVGVDVEIKEAGINNGVWETYDKKVSHLNSSGRMGEGENIVIYGHNKDDVFGPIRYIKEGSNIELFDSEENRFLYKVFKTDVVKPTDMQYVLPKEEEILTLYTCTGMLDTQRFIVLAKPFQDQ